MAPMSEATDILRSYVRLVERLSGAASVSLYVPPGAGGEREILLHEGRSIRFPSWPTRPRRRSCTTATPTPAASR